MEKRRDQSWELKNFKVNVTWCNMTVSTVVTPRYADFEILQFCSHRGLSMTLEPKKRGGE